MERLREHGDIMLLWNDEALMHRKGGNHRTADEGWHSEKMVDKKPNCLGMLCTHLGGLWGKLYYPDGDTT